MADLAELAILYLMDSQLREDIADASVTASIAREGAKTQFRSYDAVAKAVDDVSLDLYQAKPWGWWESPAAAKSVTALDHAVDQGPAWPHSAEGSAPVRSICLAALPKRMRRSGQGRISMIFQEPMTS
jgi:peptide/nickel transport system ATP-binding protein/oligopeptide transport system ATP-binding protein